MTDGEALQSFYKIIINVIETFLLTDVCVCFARMAVGNA